MGNGSDARGAEQTKGNHNMTEELSLKEQIDLALVIEDIIEHEDESCTVTVQFGPKVHKNLVESGLALVFRCAAAGISIDEALERVSST